ncbi:hypothetical protein [uncultured Shewanella sp.]|uniref:hypothetical protein n=1 Tax=uncultured Shewanella sp. TaxID=173975 RepID=UPI002635C5F1|nr:hypothetical protein [uncultured Shewanella sp.]
MIKYKLMLIAVMMMPLSLMAGTNIWWSQVDYVYQLDDPLTFEFNSNVTHSCGSALYRVKSPNEDIANRKFAIVMAAFRDEKNLAFYDSKVCEGSRSVVQWVRITN